MTACESTRVRAAAVDCLVIQVCAELDGVPCTILHRSEVMVSSLFLNSRALLFYTKKFFEGVLIIQ